MAGMELPTTTSQLRSPAYDCSPRRCLCIVVIQFSKVMSQVEAVSVAFGHPQPHLPTSVPRVGEGTLCSPTHAGTGLLCAFLCTCWAGLASPGKSRAGGQVHPLLQAGKGRMVGAVCPGYQRCWVPHPTRQGILSPELPLRVA